MRIIQISDTHISHHGGDTNDNARKAIELINQLSPDLVVHSGDVTILDPDSDADRVTAHAILAEIDAPVRVLPGNHDIGEPGPDPFAGKTVTSARISAFRKLFGEDHFVQELGTWSVVGFNSELFDSGLPEEATQWAWLESLPEQLAGRPTLVFTHKPIWAHTAALQIPKVAVSGAALPRLERVLAQLNVRAYGSGHLHHYAVGRRGQALTVSAAPTAFVHRSPEVEQKTGPGLNQIGIVVFELTGEEVLPFFRSRLDFVEKEIQQIAAGRIAIEAMGLTVPTSTH